MVSGTRPRPRTIALKLAHRVRARGPREVLDLAVGRVKEAISSDETLIFFVRDATGTPPVRDEAVFRKTTRDDAVAYASDVGTDSVSTFVARLEESTDCFVVELGERIVHATWVAHEPSWVREIQRYFIPPEGDAYIFESYTRPEVRGQGIYPFAIASLAATLGLQGTGRLWVGVEGHNPASTRAVTKAGFRDAFTIGYSRRAARLRLSAATGAMAEVGATSLVETPAVRLR